MLPVCVHLIIIYSHHVGIVDDKNFTALLGNSSRTDVQEIVMGPESLLLCSQESAIGPYPEP
jgi:hypothetical protein